MATYGRWSGRPPHRHSKTVRASFPAHGSSVKESLSRTRLATLNVCTDQARMLHPGLQSEWTARLSKTHCLPAPTFSLSPSPRQPISRLSRKPLLLGESLLSMVYGWLPAHCPVRTIDRLLRSVCRFVVTVGWCSTPGLYGVNTTDH
jgi:hypothetical protein